MKVGQTKYIVQTLGGEIVTIRNSKAFAENDVRTLSGHGEEYVVIELEVKAIHVKPSAT